MLKRLVLLVGVVATLLAYGSSEAAITLVQKKPSGTTTPRQVNAGVASDTLTFDSANVVGNLLVVFVNTQMTVAHTLTITDNKTGFGQGTYSAAKTDFQDSIREDIIFVINAASSGSGLTITATWDVAPNGSWQWGIAEFSGIASSSPNESGVTTGLVGDGPGTPLVTPNIVGTATTELYAAVGGQDGGTETLTLSSSGWVELWNTGGALGNGMAYKIGSGTDAASWTISGFNNALAIGVAFKGASAAATPSRMLLGVGQ